MGVRELTDDERSDLRDHFAAKAMQSLIPLLGKSAQFHVITACAYQYADAMIAERDK